MSHQPISDFESHRNEWDHLARSVVGKEKAAEDKA